LTRPKLLFLATEDWFVRSHFLPLIRRGLADGFEVLVWARNSGALSSEPGVRIIDADFDRLKVLPWDIHRQTADLKKVLARERPDVVHAIALKPIVLLLQTGFRSCGRVLALTGRGFLAIDDRPWKRLLRAQIQSMLRRASADPSTILLVENDADGRWAVAKDHFDRVALMPGAGVDAGAFVPSTEPSQSVTVGILSRLIRSKGVDLAVEAVNLVRARGLDLSLVIGGTVDDQNPDCYRDRDIDLWGRLPGVALSGRVEDAPAFWRNVHIGCLPSRGGEGLPRTLIEAAACGRAIVTSDAPGCLDFVGGGEIGIVTPRGDVEALAAALSSLALDHDMRRRMGAAGRAKVVAGYTEAHAAGAAARAWRAVRPQ